MAAVRVDAQGGGESIFLKNDPFGEGTLPRHCTQAGRKGLDLRQCHLCPRARENAGHSDEARANRFVDDIFHVGPPFLKKIFIPTCC